MRAISNVSLRRPNDGRPDPAYRWARIGPRVKVDPNPPSVLHARADRDVDSSRRNSSPQCIIPRIKVFDQLLAHQAILMAAPALLDGCNGLRTRSLKPRRVAVSNRPTVTPLSWCATPASGANSTHPSPSARQFRLPFNGLAQSKLRRIFCRDECPCARFAARSSRSPRSRAKSSTPMKCWRRRRYSGAPSDLVPTEPAACVKMETESSVPMRLKKT